ncbi:MAG: AcrR family transcriptional regulator [Methylophagaceae bacterium]|jgi:AcrR family transcriptional regulator
MAKVDRPVYTWDMMIKQTQTNSLSAHDRILLTAHDLFYAEGIRATGIDQIIKQAKVTKVTFYRHFPSKNTLIIAFLAYWHQRWMCWFTESIKRHGNTIDALIPTLLEWFGSEQYRGCAFINSVGEFGETMPRVIQLSQQHKHDMTKLVETLLPDSADKVSTANALALAIDGAIICSQIEQHPDSAIAGFKKIVRALTAKL